MFMLKSIAHSTEQKKSQRKRIYWNCWSVKKSILPIFSSRNEMFLINAYNLSSSYLMTMAAVIQTFIFFVIILKATAQPDNFESVHCTVYQFFRFFILVICNQKRSYHDQPGQKYTKVSNEFVRNLRRRKEKRNRPVNDKKKCMKDKKNANKIKKT